LLSREYVLATRPRVAKPTRLHLGQPGIRTRLRAGRHRHPWAGWRERNSVRRGCSRHTPSCGAPPSLRLRGVLRRWLLRTLALLEKILAPDGVHEDDDARNREDEQAQPEHRKHEAAEAVADDAEVVNLLGELIDAFGNLEHLPGLPANLHFVVALLAEDFENVLLGPIVDAVDLLRFLQFGNSNREGGGDNLVDGNDLRAAGNRGSLRLGWANPAEPTFFLIFFGIFLVMFI